MLIKDPKVKLCKAHASKYRLKSSMGQTRDTNGIDNWIVELFIGLLYGRDVELWLLIVKHLLQVLVWLISHIIPSLVLGASIILGPTFNSRKSQVDLWLSIMWLYLSRKFYLIY